MELLKIAIVQGDPPTLALTGELDLSTGDRLKAALEEAVVAHPGVVVDMAGVTFIDASGLRPVLQVADALNGSGPLRLVNASRVEWLLKLAGLNGSGSIAIRDEGVERRVGASGR